MAHIPLEAKERKLAIEERLKKQRSKEPELKYCIRPGINDLAVLLKYRSSNKYLPNPYTQISMQQFDKKGDLPKIRTLARKISGESDVEMMVRERFEKAQELIEKEDIANDDFEPGDSKGSGDFQIDKRKRGFMSPPEINERKKSKTTNKDVQIATKNFSYPLLFIIFLRTRYVYVKGAIS